MSHIVTFDKPVPAESLRSLKAKCKRLGIRVVIPKKPAKKVALHEYRIDFGNSNNGAIGAVVYLYASSPKAALKQFREGFEEAFVTKRLGMEVRIYITPGNVTLDNVERADT